MAKIRTNVRFLLCRAQLRALALFAPAAADRRALAVFATPARRAPARTPVADGLVARPGFVEGPTGRLATWSWGEGPVVLLVHGWSGDAAQMARFIPGIVEAGFSALAFDQPAHGQSAGRRSSALLFRDAIGAIARTAGPFAGVVAHSLGATAAALSVASGVPARRLVLLAPPSEPASFARQFGQSLRLPPDRIRGMLAEMDRTFGARIDELDLVRLAPQIKAPTLIVHDEDDAEVPSHHGRAVAKAAAGVRFLSTRGLGHRGLLKAPAVIDAAVQFVAGGFTEQLVPRMARPA